MAKTLRYRDVERALLARDKRFRFDGAKGSEIKLSHPASRATVRLPHHGDGEIIGARLLARIVRTFELPRDFFAPASPKAKPTREAVASAAFDILNEDARRRDGYWSRRASTGAFSCHFFRWEPRGSLGKFVHTMGAWYEKGELRLRLHGPSLRYAGDLRKRTPSQIADMIDRVAGKAARLQSTISKP